VTNEVSLVRGGLFYRAQQLVGLIHPNRWNLGRRIIILIAVGWLPMLLITAFSNWGSMPSLLTDYRAHSRLLVGVPVLLLWEPLVESSFREVFAHIRHASLLEAPDVAYMDRIIAALARLRDSFLPELAILVLVVLRTVTAYRGQVDATPWLGQAAGADFHLTAAGWYAILVSVSLYQFLLGLSLWKWLPWTFFAFKLSRRNMKLVPTHPDKTGGLGFLGMTSLAFAPVAFSAVTVIGGTWRHEILHQGAHLMHFKLQAVALVVIIVLFALGPLVFFAAPLAALRHRGILEYGILGQKSSTAFHAKWILHGVGEQTEFLHALDSSVLSSYGVNYNQIEGLKPFPSDRIALYALAVATVIPALPVVLAELPLTVVLKELFGALR
jgi:hypothetical protein